MASDKSSISEMFTSSAKQALNPLNIIGKFLLWFVFAVILSLRTLIQELDKAEGFIGIAKAFFAASRDGVLTTLSSIWDVLSNWGFHYANTNWGTIFFTIFFGIFVIAYFFMPVSFIINIFDMKKGHATNFFVRLIITLVVVLIASLITNKGGVEAFTSDVNDSIDNSLGTMENVSIPLVDGVTEAENVVEDIDFLFDLNGGS